MSIIRLENLLKSSGGSRLEKIVQTAQNMEDLTVLLRGSLDDDAAASLLAASLHDDGELVLFCSSPAWASRLRFDGEKLLAIACEHGVAATRCRVRVASQIPAPADGSQA